MTIPIPKNSKGDVKNGLFGFQTGLDHMNTLLVAVQIPTVQKIFVVYDGTPFEDRPTPCSSLNKQ